MRTIKENIGCCETKEKTRCPRDIRRVFWIRRQMDAYGVASGGIFTVFPSTFAPLSRRAIETTKRTALGGTCCFSQVARATDRTRAKPPRKLYESIQVSLSANRRIGDSEFRRFSTCSYRRLSRDFTGHGRSCDSCP